VNHPSADAVLRGRSRMAAHRRARFAAWTAPPPPAPVSPAAPPDQHARPLDDHVDSASAEGKDRHHA
jgi:hypothetical protein